MSSYVLHPSFEPPGLEQLLPGVLLGRNARRVGTERHDHGAVLALDLDGVPARRFGLASPQGGGLADDVPESFRAAGCLESSRIAAFDDDQWDPGLIVQCQVEKRLVVRQHAGSGSSRM